MGVKGLEQWKTRHLKILFAVSIHVTRVYFSSFVTVVVGGFLHVEGGQRRAAIFLFA